MKKLLLSIFGLLIISNLFAQMPTYPISTVNKVNSQGIPDSMNLYCKVIGVVAGVNLSGSNGYQFSLIDPSNGEGIGVFAPGTITLNYTVKEGDRLRVIGKINHFRGLLQVNVDSVALLSSLNDLPDPIVVTQLNDFSESKLVRLNNLVLVTPSQWPAPGATGSGANVDVSNGSTTFQMRIDADVELFGTAAPSGSFSLIGLGGQFNVLNSQPYNTGYQILPRYKSDIFGTVALASGQFNAGADTTAENAAPKKIKVYVSPSANAGQMVKIAISNGSGVIYGANKTYTTNPAAVNDTLSIYFPANVGLQTFTLTTYNDSLQGPNKNVIFSIVQTSIGIGNPGSLNMLIKDAGGKSTSAIPTYTICQVNSENAQGVADSTGVTCKVIGTVLGVNMSGTSGWSFTIVDNNCGISTFAPATKTLNYTVTEGDKVRVIGKIEQFRGLTQINMDSVVLISQGNPIPTPTIVTAVGASSKSKLIRLNNLTLVTPSQWPSAGGAASGANVDVTDGINTFLIRIDKDVNIWNTPAPTTPFDLIGIGGQFNSTTTAPFLDGYQILPRYTTDIIPIALPDTILPFNVIGPVDNSRIVLQGAPGQLIQAKWRKTRTINNSLVKYSWDLNLVPQILPSLLSVPSDNSGLDTASTLTYGAVSDILSNSGIGVGDSIQLYWSIIATNMVNGTIKQANQVRFIKLVRGIITSNPNISTSDFNIYPNPAMTEVNITFNEQNKFTTASIYDLTGKMVINHFINNQKSIKISTSDLSKGVYLIRLTGETKSLSSKLIIIN